MHTLVPTLSMIYMT